MTTMQIDPDQVNIFKYGSDRTNTQKNLEMLNAPGTLQHALTVFEGKIYDFDARPGNELTPKMMKATELIDVNNYWNHKNLLRQGKKEEAENIIFSTDLMDDLAKEAAIQNKKVNDSSQPYYRTLGSAGLGNTINTAYEVVRRVNYLTNVSSPSYNMANFNGKNAFNVISTTDLNLKGFYKNALPTGQPEIGDHVTPDVSKLGYTAFEKSIYADSFRYEFTMREVKDSVFSLESQVQNDIPGIFAKMEDDKCTTLLNAISSSGTISPKWDAVSGNFYTADAASDVETAEVALDNYGSGDTIMLPRGTLRSYLKNIQSAINTLAPNSLQKPDSVRTGIMPRNPNLTYFVNNTITAASFIVVSRMNYADFYQGPKVNISYRNQFTPGQIEGRILLSFNGAREKITAAASRYVGVV